MKYDGLPIRHASACNGAKYVLIRCPPFKNFVIGHTGKLVCSYARLAKLADAYDSGSYVRKDVRVRPPCRVLLFVVIIKKLYALVQL